MKEETKKLLANSLKLDLGKVEDDVRIVEDLGYDSLDTVEMLMSIEEQWNISIPDEEAMKLKTLGDVSKYLETLN
jgi:acyl carrier protein